MQAPYDTKQFNLAALVVKKQTKLYQGFQFQNLYKKLYSKMYKVYTPQVGPQPYCGIQRSTASHKMDL